MTQKGKSAQAPRNNPSSQVRDRMEVAKALFADVMEGSSNTTVDPRDCIPLTNVRAIVRLGVERMKVLFRGHAVAEGNHEAGEAPHEPGITAGSDMPVLMPLTGTYRRYVIDHFKGKGLTETEAREKSRTRTQWYGVVDGMHRLVAILELIDELPAQWSGFSWSVTILSGGHNVQVLRQLARHQNGKHAPSYYIGTTFYDTLCGLREEAARLKAEKTAEHRQQSQSPVLTMVVLIRRRAP